MWDIRRGRHHPKFAGHPISVKKIGLTALMVALAIGVLLPVRALAVNAIRHPNRVAVFISREIQPYLQAADGLGRLLNESGALRISEIIFEASAGNDPVAFQERISKEGYDLVVTIGPEVARFMVTHRPKDGVPIIYSMLLDPEKIFSSVDRACGVSLNIPLAAQLFDIKKTLPRIHTVGILYDPKNNERFLSDAVITGKRMGLQVIPIGVSEKKQIPGALGGSWHQTDALWVIPDATVISESIVKYMIKEALLKKVPVIGYNRSFHDYGAAVTFILDYDRIGRQTAGLVLERLEKGVCREASPEYNILINRQVLNQIGVVFEEPSLEKVKNP